MLYIQYEFETKAPHQKDELIALLSTIGFDGFEEVDNHFLKAFIVESNFNQLAFDEVLSNFEAIIYNVSSIENINWNQQWEQSFEPIIVPSKNNNSPFVAIRASFHQPINNVAHELIVTPKMSFGTGHHATTFMVVQLMENIDFENKTVIDFGTGTGVLAILAEKMGANFIKAIDNDEWSITNTIENIEQNNCTNIEVELVQAMPTSKQYDIIIANINLNVIKDNILAIKNSSKQGSNLLFSGFLFSDQTAMMQILVQNQLTHVTTVQKGDWIAMHAICQ
jgi:ribosomal protein L11 methyltransferase